MTGWPLSTMILQLGHTYIKLLLSQRDRVADIKHTSEALGILYTTLPDKILYRAAILHLPFSLTLGYLNPSLSCQVRSSFSRRGTVKELQQCEQNNHLIIWKSSSTGLAIVSCPACKKTNCKSRGRILTLWDPSPWSGTETDQWVDIVGSSSNTTL